jgi:hypothetical protein
MLELIKETERVVKKFNNTPNECRYYYCKTFKTLLHIEKITYISIKENGIGFYMKCYVVGKEDCIDSLVLNNDIKLVTLDEAMKEQSEYENSLSAKYYKLKSELKDLEEELKELGK